MDKIEKINKLLTDDTKRSFIGPFGSFRLIYNEEYGPFFRLDKGNFVSEFEKNSGEESLKNRKLSLNLNHIIKYRTVKLNDLINEDTEDISQLERKIGTAFIKSNSDEIELDPDFKLLNIFQNIFKCQKIKNKIINVWEKTSHGRWCGKKEPRDFLDAHKKYFLPHLIPKTYDELKSYYLFSFSFKLINNDFRNAEIFFGKTYNGSEVQYKFNNHAAHCITNIKYIKCFRIRIIQS
jgi:hypothetical protein